MAIKPKAKKVVVIGGGTGTYTVLSGLKHFPPRRVELTAIVTVADSGGSTGRLRDEFGYLPVGDVRMALAALADSNGSSFILRELFQYRFKKGGKELSGHSFGNLFLVAMTDILGSEEKAIEFASSVLRVRGKVLPVSTHNVTLVAEYADGTIVRGETHIDEPEPGRDGTARIQKLWLEPESQITPEAAAAIANADLIILGPGDVYTSLLANVVVGGVAEALQTTKAKFLYICNLMTKYGQTSGFTLSDHVAEMKKYVGRQPDIVLVNNAPFPADIEERYASQHEYPVVDDMTKSSSIRIIRADLLATEEVTKPSGDTLKRSLIRHDSDKLADQIALLIGRH